MAQTKVIASTEAQNNFGQILSDVTQNNTRYVIKRHDFAQAIILSLADFAYLSANQSEQNKLATMVREIAPAYTLGIPLQGADDPAT